MALDRARVEAGGGDRSGRSRTSDGWIGATWMDGSLPPLGRHRRRVLVSLVSDGKKREKRA